MYEKKPEPHKAGPKFIVVIRGDNDFNSISTIREKTFQDVFQFATKLVELIRSREPSIPNVQIFSVKQIRDDQNIIDKTENPYVE